MSALNTLATRQYNASEDYSDVVHFVHVYVPEPHPMRPDPSPYTGRVAEREYSQRPQARTYSEREAAASEVAAMLEGPQLMLVDEFLPMRSNPVWCSYGPMPNPAYLIDQRGIVRLAQNWVDTYEIEKEILELLGD